MAQEQEKKEETIIGTFNHHFLCQGKDGKFCTPPFRSIERTGDLRAIITGFEEDPTQCPQCDHGPMKWTGVGQSSRLQREDIERARDLLMGVVNSLDGVQQKTGEVAARLLSSANSLGCSTSQIENPSSE